MAMTTLEKHWRSGPPIAALRKGQPVSLGINHRVDNHGLLMLGFILSALQLHIYVARTVLVRREEKRMLTNEVR